MQAAPAPAPAAGQEPLLWLPVLGAGQRQPGGRARAARHQLRRDQEGAHTHPRLQVSGEGDSSAVVRYSARPAVHLVRGVCGPFLEPQLQIVINMTSSKQETPVPLSSD